MANCQDCQNYKFESEVSNKAATDITNRLAKLIQEKSRPAVGPAKIGARPAVVLTCNQISFGTHLDRLRSEEFEWDSREFKMPPKWRFRKIHLCETARGVRVETSA